MVNPVSYAYAVDYYLGQKAYALGLWLQAEREHRESHAIAFHATHHSLRQYAQHRAKEAHIWKEWWRTVFELACRELAKLGYK